MIAKRPYAEGATLFGAAEEVWWSLAEEDWLEAFSHHPRIGERKAAEASTMSQAWSRQEQAAVASAEDSVQAALEAGNRAYEERFGYVFLIRAAGRSGDEILAELRRRLDNDAAAEIRQAASQQVEITALRLAKLIG
jgi:OHCU decarboxylase